MLWGPGESGQLPRVYVGEGDLVLPRLGQHAKQKDFWTHAVVFTSKDQSLNKAHVQYLEARLVALAREAKRAELDNGNVPQMPALSEADAADAEGFLADLLLCLPVVGVSVFEKAKAGTGESRDLFLKAKGIEARGVDGPEGFVVRTGAQAVKDEVASIPCESRRAAEVAAGAGGAGAGGRGLSADAGLHLQLALYGRGCVTRPLGQRPHGMEGREGSRTQGDPGRKRPARHDLPHRSRRRAGRPGHVRGERRHGADGPHRLPTSRAPPSRRASPCSCK